MSKTEASAPVDLSVMLGGSDDFHAKGKKYIVKPMLLEHVEEFIKDGIGLGPQLFSFAKEESRKKVCKWLSRYVTDANGEAMSLEKAMGDKWDVVDMKNFIRKLCDLSG